MAPKKLAQETLKTEDKRLRDYELVLIISPEVVDEAVNATIENVSQFIRERDGTISNEERWGKRKLAYPLERFMEGNYVLIQFKMKPGASRELEAKLQISEEVLRHLLVRLGN